MSEVKLGEGSFMKLLKRNGWLLVCTFLLSGVYFVISAISDGMYQHDEAAHFVSMRNFWHEPSSILGNWAKAGFKIIYALPSLLGETFVKFVNCLFAAFTSYFAYKIVKHLKGKFAVLAFALLATQPMWLQLSFRNYSEIISAFILVLTVFLHLKNKQVWAAFALAYLALIRQEFYLFLGIYGIYLLINKNFKAVLFASIPPIGYALWGALATGEPIFIVNTIIGTSSTYGDAYPRQGFGHYPLVSEVIYGVTVLTLVFSYLGNKLVNFKKPNWLLLIPSAIFFLLYCLFNSTTLDFGPSSAGNHRYLVIISPIIAIMAALGVEELRNANKKLKVLFVLIPFLFVVGYFWTYLPSANGLSLGSVRAWRPLFVAILTAVVVLLPIKNNSLITVLLVLFSIGSTAKGFTKIKNTDENRTMEKVVKWYEGQIKESKRNENSLIKEETPVYSQHVLFLYYQGVTKYDFVHEMKNIDHNYVDTAQVGSLIIWDSHYSYRPKLRATSIKDEYFINRPHEYRLVKTFPSRAGNFNAKVFLKQGVKEENFEQGITHFDSTKYAAALPFFNAAISANSQNYAAYYFAGACYQNTKDYNTAYGYYTRCIEINNTYPKAFLNRGNLLSNAGRFDDAIKDLTAYLNLKPSDPQGYFNRASAYFNSNKFQEAITDYSKVAQLSPKFAQTYYNVGMAQVQLKQQANACVNFKKALELGYKQAEQAIQQHCK